MRSQIVARPARFRALAVVVLAVSLALAACAVSAPASSPSPSQVATSTTAPSPIAATPSAAAVTTEPSHGPDATAWQPKNLFPVEAGPINPTMVIGETGGNNAGFVVAALAREGPRAWSSPDGGVWVIDTLQTVPQSQAVPYTGVIGPDRSVLLGVGGGQCAHPVADFTWARPLPGFWSAAPWQDLFCAGGQGNIATDGHTYVIAGTGAGDQPFLWSSQDGLSWTNTPIAVEIAPAALVWTGSEFLSLARAGSGFSALTSPDGITWEGAPATGLPTGGLPRLFALSGRVVALLGGPDGKLVAYERQAGGSWQSGATTGLEASAGDVTNATTSSGIGFVFLSTTAAGGAVLSSTDGLTWRTVPTPTANRFIGAAVVGDLSLLVGVQDAGSESQALAWSALAVLLRGE